MGIRVLNIIFVLILILAGVILGQVMREAMSASFDPFVYRLEVLLGVHPGQLLPVDMRAPDIRLQYRGTRPVGHNCYEVNVCRAR
jgi:hypothetical protein